MTKKENREELAWNKKQQEFKEKEQKLLPQKIELYKIILAWRDEFVKTKQFKKAIREMGECTIFWNDWGHTLPRFGGPGCWSKLTLNKKGVLEYQSGYKWMGGTANIIFTRNPKTAKKFTYQYLSELHGAIKTGKIYQDIAKELGNLETS